MAARNASATSLAGGWWPCAGGSELLAPRGLTVFIIHIVRMCTFTGCQGAWQPPRCGHQQYSRLESVVSCAKRFPHCSARSTRALPQLPAKTLRSLPNCRWIFDYPHPCAMVRPWQYSGYLLRVNRTPSRVVPSCCARAPATASGRAVPGPACRHPVSSRARRPFSPGPVDPSLESPTRVPGIRLPGQSSTRKN